MNLCVILSLFFSSISLLICFSLIFCYLKYRLLNTLFLKLVFHLLIASCGHCLSFFFVTLNDSEVICSIEGVFSSFFTFGIFCWTFNICLIIAFTFLSPDSLIRENGNYSIIGSWGVPCLLTIMHYIFNGYKKQEYWCWISDKRGSLMFWIYYFPFFFALISILLIYLRLSYFWNTTLLAQNVLTELKTSKQRGQPEHSVVKIRLRVYILVFMICNGVDFLYHISLQSKKINSYANAIALVYSVVVPLQGGLNALVFAVNRRLLISVKQNWNDVKNPRVRFIDSGFSSFSQSKSKSNLINNNEDTTPLFLGRD